MTGPGRVEGAGDTAASRAVRALQVGTTHLVVLLDPDGTVAYVAPSVTFLLGYRPEEVTGRNFRELMHPDDLGEALPALAADADRPDRGLPYTIEKDIPAELRILDAEGDWVPFELRRNAMLADPDVAGTLVIGQQIRGRYAFDDALGAIAWDDDGIDAIKQVVRYLDVRLPGTNSCVLLSGAPVGGGRSEWIGASGRTGSLLTARGPWERSLQTASTTLAVVDRPGDLDEDLAERARALGYVGCWCVPLPVPRNYELPKGRLPTSEGYPPPGADTRLGCLVVWSEAQPLPPPGHLSVLGRTGRLMEIALRRRTESHRLRRLVDYDHVTGALSRVGMRSIISRGDAVPRAHLLVDLDDFKAVNDGHGHSVGDEVLRLAVRRVVSVLRHQDLVVRLGGDEFLVLLAGADAEAAASAAQRIFAALSQPISVGSGTVVIGTSIGVAPYDREVSFDELTDRADQAMYRAKRSGKNRWAIWSEGM